MREICRVEQETKMTPYQSFTASAFSIHFFARKRKKMCENSRRNPNTFVYSPSAQNNFVILSAAGHQPRVCCLILLAYHQHTPSQLSLIFLRRLRANLACVTRANNARVRVVHKKERKKKQCKRKILPKNTSNRGAVQVNELRFSFRSYLRRKSRRREREKKVALNRYMDVKQTKFLFHSAHKLRFNFKDTHTNGEAAQKLHRLRVLEAVNVQVFTWVLCSWKQHFLALSYFCDEIFFIYLGRCDQM